MVSVFDKDYKEIIWLIEENFAQKESFSVNSILRLNELRPFNYEVLGALIKRLIRQKKLIIINKGRRFEEHLLTWNSDDIPLKFPTLSRNEFENVEICMTLPPFNIIGLTNFLNNQKIKLNTLLKEFEILFSSARKNIKICSPFIEWNGFEYFRDLLILKATKGIQIEILSREISQRIGNPRNSDMLKIYKSFENEGLADQIKIRNYYFLTEENRLASSIHSKLIVIDGKIAYVGSGEIRKNSFEKNLEIGLILRGEKVKELELIFDSIFSRSEVISFD